MRFAAENGTVVDTVIAPQTSAAEDAYTAVDATAFTNGHTALDDGIGADLH